MSLYRLRDSVLHAGARLLNDLGGVLLTRLVADLPAAPAGTVAAAEALRADVETTYGFPAAGRVLIDGEVIPYASKTNTRFASLTRDDTRRETARSGALVALHTADGSGAHSDLDRARQMMLVDTAEGAFLDVLGRNYGVGRYLGANDTLYRAMIRALAYQAGKGSRTAIGEFLDLATIDCRVIGTDGVIDADAVTLSSAAEPFTAGMKGLRVRLAGTGKNARECQIVEVVDAGTVRLDRRGSPWWAAADLEDESDVGFTVLPWDVWRSPWHPGVCFIRLACPQPADARGAAFIHGGEAATSSAVDTVTVAEDIRQVLGVWLATDVFRLGTNYATDNNFSGKVITLDTDLPAANTEVVVDYGRVENPPGTPDTGVPGAAGGRGTAQVLPDIESRNVGDPLPHAPAYVGNRNGVIERLLEALVIAGVEPRVSTILF